MTTTDAIGWINALIKAMHEETSGSWPDPEYKDEVYSALEMAIQALSQEPCELLIIKSNIFLHQDDRKKWMESIKREKENGVIILPPYFEPLLVPNDIEINMEQEPCDDAISREAVIKILEKYNLEMSKIAEDVSELPSVTQKSGKWLITPMSNIAHCSECDYLFKDIPASVVEHFKYCPNCSAKMVKPQESEVNNG